MIAGNGEKRDIKVGMTAPGEREVVISISAVEAYVTGVDDKIRSERRDDACHRSKVREEPGPVSPQVRIGDLNEVERAHKTHGSAQS